MAPLCMCGVSVASRLEEAPDDPGYALPFDLVDLHGDFVGAERILDLAGRVV